MIGANQIGLTSAPALFVPTDLGSTLQALYVGSGIVQSGGSVSAWNDSSGNGYNLAPLAGHEPGYTANNGGGQPAITCVSGNQWLGGPNVNVRVRSFFAVLSHVNVPAIGCFCGAGRVYLMLNTANSLEIFSNSFGPSSGQVIGAGRHSLACVMRSAVDMDFYLDGAMVNATNGASFYPDTPITMCNENRNSGNFQTCDAHVEHMALMDSALGPTDVAKMLGYISRIYGV